MLFRNKELTNCMKSSSSLELALIGGACSFTFFVPLIASATPAPVVPKVSNASCDSNKH